MCPLEVVPTITPSHTATIHMSYVFTSFCISVYICVHIYNYIYIYACKYMYTYAYVQDSSRGVSKQCAITQPVSGFTCCTLSGIRGNYKSVSICTLLRSLKQWPHCWFNKTKHSHNLLSLPHVDTLAGLQSTWLESWWRLFPFIYVRKRKTNRWYQISELYTGSLHFQWNALTTRLLQVYACWRPDSGVDENWYTYACVCICTHFDVQMYTIHMYTIHLNTYMHIRKLTYICKCMYMCICV